MSMMVCGFLVTVQPSTMLPECFCLFVGEAFWGYFQSEDAAAKAAIAVIEAPKC